MTTTARDVFADEYHKQVGDTGDHHHKTSINPYVFRFLGDVQNKRVLDLACGQGYFARVLAKMGAIVTGCDLSQKLISLAQQQENDEKLGILYDICSADALPYQAEAFDSIVCNMSVHDMENISAVFGQCQKVLKSGGSFIFSTIHPMKTLNKKLVDEQGRGLMVRTYMTETKQQREQFGNTRLFHRPLAYYFHALFENGFLIADFKEIVTIGLDDIEDQQIAYKQEVPSFIVCRAVKV